MVNREIFTKQFTGLILANMFFWMSTNIFLPVLPIYYHSLGMNDQQVGIAVGAFSVGAILFRIFSGKAVDQYGGTRIIACGILLSTVSIISYIFSHTLLTAVLSRFFHGVGISFYSAAALTTASLIHADKHTAEALASYTLFAMFGVGIANASSNYLYQLGSFTLVMVIGGIATILSLLLYPKNPKLSIRSAAAPMALPIAEVIRLPAVYVPTFSLLAVQFCFGSAMTFMPLLMLSHHISEISPFYIAYAITVVLSRIWVSQLCTRYTAQRVAYAILLLFAVSLLFVGLFPSTLTLILCGAGLGVGYGLAFPSLATIITNATTPANRGTAFGIYTTAIDAGIGIGSIGMGFVAGKWGYTAVFLSASVYVLLYAMLYRAVLRRRLEPVIEKG